VKAERKSHRLASVRSGASTSIARDVKTISGADAAYCCKRCHGDSGITTKKVLRESKQTRRQRNLVYTVTPLPSGTLQLPEATLPASATVLTSDTSGMR
jgi:hypothetical protein